MNITSSRRFLHAALVLVAAAAAPLVAAPPDRAAAPTPAPAPAAPSARNGTPVAAPTPAPVAPGATPRRAAAAAPRAGTPAPGMPTWEMAIPREMGLLPGPHAYLGVSTVEIGAELRKHWGAPAESGVLIGFVEEDSPAAGAGLHVGDVLVAIDGEKVEASWDVSRILRTHAGGDRVRLDVRRDGRNLTLDATLIEREGQLLPERDVLFFRQPVGAALAGQPTTAMVAPECADLGRRFGECLGAAGPPAFEQIRVRRGELEKRVEELEVRLRSLEKELGKNER